MLINHDREKLVEAISYFAHNTRKLGKTKLFKLLYFLDFEHFKATGRSVTGLRYYAWPMGPVPVALHNEVPAPAADLASAVEINETEIKNGTMYVVRPRREFSAKFFSKRELALLASLAKEYRNATADEMVEATHLENLPWDQVYNKEGRKQEEIPYDLAARTDERETIMRVANERRELLESIPNEPGVGIFR